MASSLAKYDSIADRIKQHRQADSRGVLIVEGQSDRNLIGRISGNRWAIFIAGTRNSVPGVVAEAQGLGVDRVAGLIDRDFDDFCESLPSSDSSSNDEIFTFEEADLEATLVRGKWFESLVEEYASHPKLAKLGGAYEVRRLAVGIAGVIGLVRTANSADGWGIDFDDLDFSRKVQARDLTLAVPKLIAALQPLIETAAGKAKVKELLAAVDTSVDRGAGSFRGRDALEVLRVGLRKLLATKHIDDVELLACALRLTADESLLMMEPLPTIARRLAEVS